MAADGSCSDRLIGFLAWALAASYLGHGLVSFAQGWAGIADEWWLYGPGGLVIGLLALIVAGSGGAWPRFPPPAASGAVVRRTERARRDRPLPFFPRGARLAKVSSAYFVSRARKYQILHKRAAVTVSGQRLA